MSADQLTVLFAGRVMGWRVAPGRFLLGKRRWIPRWRFQPTGNLEDAFRLLEKAAPQEYSMRGDNKGNFRVQVRIGDGTGEADGASKPHAISCAIARALGIQVEGAENDAV